MRMNGRMIEWESDIKMVVMCGAADAAPTADG